MFPKRQAEIAHDYGRISGHEVLTPANLIDHVSTNPAAGELAAELVGQARGQLDQFRPMLAIIAGVEPTDEQLDKVTFVLTQRLADLMPQARGIVAEHLSQSLRPDQLSAERMSVRHTDQFERMLGGIFEQVAVITVVLGRG